MKHHLPSLESLKVFESAARQLSFSLAARELCLTRGAVSYQIRRLESELDCALFRRSVRQVYLTDAGQQLLQTVQQLFSDLGQTLENINPGDSGNDVLIGATTYVALRWLSPRISAFSEKHPEISILLQHSVNTEEFRLQDVDFAIRWCHMEGQNKRNRSLEMPMPLFPVCSPRLLRRRVGRSNSTLGIADLGRAPFEETPLLCEDRPLDLWRAWFGGPLPNPRRVIADANVRTQAAIDGLGWTLADSLMQSEVDRGLLVAPFTHQLEGYGYAIESAPGRYINRNALTLREWLIEQD